MDKKPSHETSKGTLPNTKRPIARVLSLRLAAFISLITILAGVASYFYSMASTEELAREQIMKYIDEREHRESALFLESDAYQLRFQKEYVERYKRTSDKELIEWFEEHMEKRPEDGTYRSKPELYYGKDMPLGRRDVWATMMIGAKTKITPEVLRALAIGYDMVNQYGPAWRKPFEDLYFSSPEKTSVSRWPGTPWGLMMDDKVEWREEEWMAITMKEKNPQREQKWSGVLYDERNGNWMVSGVTPLDIDGKQVGMVGTDLLLDDFVERTINETLSGTYNILLQDDGRVIAHPHKVEEITANKGMLSAQTSADEHLRRVYELTQNVTTFPSVVDNNRDSEFLGVTQIQGPDWYFITVYPKSLLAERALRNVVFIFLSGMASLTAMIFVIWLVLKRNLVYPLGRLTQTVRNFEIPRGQWSGRGDEFVEKASALSTHPDEIGLLASSFLNMGDHLRTTYNELQVSEDRYKNLVVNIPGVVYQCSFDKDWTMKFMSNEIEKLAGFPYSDFTNNAARTYKSIIHPDDRQMVWDTVLEKVNKNTPFNLEYRVIHRNGSIHWVYETGQATKDRDGEVLWLDGAIFDITERKQAEVELTKLATAIKQANETVMILGTDGVITYVNPALEVQTGYSSSELIGTNIMPRDRRPDQKNLFQKAWKTISEGNIWSGHMSPRSKDGSIREFDVTISPIRDASGKITSFVSIARNVTKEIEMEERLRRAEKMEAIGTLAGGVAHDLNNVLGGIVGYPDLLLHDIPEDSPMRSSLMAIKQSGLRASAIVQDLLTLARRGVQITEAVNLNTILTRCLESVEYKKLEELNPDAKIVANLEKDLLNIMGSPVHLSKTVINLLSNAVEATPGSGKITITSENRYLDTPIKGYDRIKEGDYVVLSIKDNGTGIASEDLDKIFEPFYTKKVMGRSGTGLGMAVVWGTVKDHRGYIDVKSIEGQGTTFTLYFPVTREEVEIVKEPVLIKEYSGKGEKILIVDDIESQRDIAANLLKKLNYTVETVASGEEALEYMRSNTADLLVLDMIMDPGIDGLATYKGIINLRPGQKAIIASGFSETDRVREAQKLGAGAYIRKPYTLEKIGLAVKTELERRS